ncbi:ATP-dependent DNA helicase [Mycobacterium asiaticum]|uniref:ATP-dependent DNA helicase RecQ n=1 Tax=Mycobacterium asiaticum TaxID=1790 RepID=A0A1A3P2C9_MYCAS|nr:RecQ family ATP-dependent DNA helicase [Mycobacterium asiaticum]OBK27429.1 ATP-dependent DNA helicase [Mycobacterium asiaticum]
MPESRKPLPPAFDAAHRILVEQGPQPASTLVEQLRAAGFHQRIERINRLPEIFPNRFHLTVQGLISVTSTENIEDVEAPSDDDIPVDADWYRKTNARRVSTDRVAVLDIETTGLDAIKDDVLQIALVRLDGSPIADLAVQSNTNNTELQRFSINEALVSMREALDGIDVLVGHNLLAFDRPFLEKVAERAGVADLRFPVCVDSLHLATLVDVSMPNRSLFDLTHRYDIVNHTPHNALSDATATADVVRRLLNEIDISQPSWQLVVAALEAFDHPLTALMPVLTAAPQLTSLERTPDPLLRPTGSPAPDAWSAARDDLALLQSRRGLRTRPAQREMAQAVAEVCDGGGLLAVEAPTGTGKSLAYLLPALGRASQPGRPVVVATATKALQGQLRAEAARLHDEGLLRAPFRQLQGVGNYICARELEDALSDRDSSPLAMAVALRAIADSPTGTWDDVTDDVIRRRDARYARTRARLRTNASGCDRARCSWAQVCPLMQQVVDIEKAPGVVSVNHALIASWAGIEAAGGRAPGDVLADGRADLVFDEAHALEDSLTAAWTQRVDALELQILVNSLSPRSKVLREVRSRAGADDAVRRNIQSLGAAGAEIQRCREELVETIGTYLHEYAGDSDSAVLRMGIVTGRPEFRDLRQSASSARYWLIQLRKAVDALRQSLGEIIGAGSQRRRLRGYSDRLDTAIEMLSTLNELPDDHLWIYKIAVEPDNPTAWTYERIPIHVFPQFQQHIVDQTHSTVLCSATLTVQHRFDYLASRLGIRIDSEPTENGFRALTLPSPFDYAKQSLVILTNHLPVPIPSNEREFCEDMAADQAGFLSLSGGRTLTLFTARRRMETVAAQVKTQSAELAKHGVELLVQGEQGRSQILHRFRSELGTVLYGLKSYWEGFDAPGETLSYLFLEKPPYPHPDDPLIAARQRAIAERGGDPFLDYVLPMTAMQFTQGFGRLIRSEDDKGAALVCDRRLHAPTQAQHVILGSLPNPAVHEASDRDDAWIRAIEFVTGSPPDLAAALTLNRDDVTQLLEDLRLLPGEEPTAKLVEAAEKLFGIPALHPKQLDVMRAFLDGKDFLAVLPTGFGKSVCYQLPALLTPEARATVIVSPLVALIKDQLNDLRGRRGIRPVQGITGTTSRVVQTEILRDIADGRVRLLYVSPERLARDPVLRGALSRQQLNRVVVDEAHCISVWGHDFRPEFRQVPSSVATFATRPPRAGLTATATREVESDINTSLQMRDPVLLREPSDRPNLRFRVTLCSSDRERSRELLRFVTWADPKPGIVYVTRRALAEEVAALLRRAGHAARAYHAGMVPEQRDAVQEDFDSDTARIIVATKAFGMGINKPNIGWVVHYDLPDSLDGYAQESGRAARQRDLTGDCLLLYTRRDIGFRKGLVSSHESKTDAELAQRLLTALWDCPKRGNSRVFDVDVLGDALGIDDDELNVNLARLERVGALKQGLDCSARGMVDVGSKEPDSPDECRLFRELFYQVHRARPNVRIQIDFQKLQQERGYDPDDLEQQLIAWSLDRLVTFSSSRRLRRVELFDRIAPREELIRESARWNAWQRRRLQAMIDYAVDASVCRRVTVAKHFGDVVADCASRGITPCDVCNAEPAPWSLVPDHLVADPETLINPQLIVLQSVAWATSYKRGHYGEASLQAAVLGKESLGEGRPLGQGVLSCPQFGALRHVRNGEKRWTSALNQCLAQGLVERRTVQRDSSSSQYQTVVLTEFGAQNLGVVLTQDD